MPQSIIDAFLGQVRGTTAANDGVVAETVESERSRFAMELHDSLGQELTGAYLLAQQLSESLHDRRDELMETADQLVAVHRQVSRTLRQLVSDLQPSGFLDDGLDYALQGLASSINGLSGTRCLFRSDLDGFTVRNRPAALHLYRIAQEATSNALKHSGAKEIEICLEQLTDGSLRLCVTDDGSGIVGKDVVGGSGVTNMFRRARIMGGSLSITPGKNQETGLTVACTVPGDYLEAEVL
ncbi:MAG: histidine kinase [Rhodothermales bacterium]